MNPALPLLSRRPLVCLVTDRRRLPGRGDERESTTRLVGLVEEAGRAAIDLVQIRERDLSGGALTDLVTRCVDVVRGTPTRIVVNDRLDVALTATAPGVHLRSDSLDGARMRMTTPPGFLLGRSVHGVEEAEVVARAGGLDYLILGAIFPSASKPADWTPLGVDELARTVRAVRLPVLAIGGVTLENVAEVARAGAAGVAAIGLFADAMSQAGEPRDRRLRAVVEAVHRSFDTWQPVV